MRAVVAGYKKAIPEQFLVFSRHPEVLEQFGCTTRERLVATIATCAAETGGFSLTAESGYYTTAARIRAVWPSRFPTAASAAKYVKNPKALFNFVYGARMGNQRDGVEDDDGWLYRGRGPGQTTGYDNYLEMERKLGLPLTKNPELLENPEIGLKAHLIEAQKLWKFADQGRRGFRAFSNGINRGNPFASASPIGWKERQFWYDRVSKVLGTVATQPQPANEPTTYRLGHAHEDIRDAQKRLQALGYVIVGNPDKVFGGLTRKAVLAFQDNNGLKLTGDLDPYTLQKLHSADAVPMTLGEERRNATAGDLEKQGSGTIKLGKGVAQLGGALTAAGGAKVLNEATGVLDSVSEGVGQFEVARDITDRASGALNWLVEHWEIAALIVGGAVLYFGYRIIARKVASYRAGKTLAA